MLPQASFQFDTITEAKLQSIHYLASPIEHTLVFTRQSGEQVNLAVQHFGSVNQLNIVVFSGDLDEPIIREESTLSFQEARLLKDLLNRPEVSEYLEQGVR